MTTKLGRPAATGTYSSVHGSLFTRAQDALSFAVQYLKEDRAARQAIWELEELDDHALKDIGLQRCEIEGREHAPLSPTQSSQPASDRSAGTAGLLTPLSRLAWAVTPEVAAEGANGDWCAPITPIVVAMTWAPAQYYPGSSTKSFSFRHIFSVGRPITRQDDWRAEMTNGLPETPNSLTGGCMCGAVRYRISEKPMAAALCHCNRCRPQSGSAFSTVIMLKRSTFELEGETTVFEDVGASGMRVGRRCCARCGSPLTTEPDVAPDIMFVKAGGIDNNVWFQPVMELFVTRRRPWVTPVPGAQQFDGNPPI